MPIIIFTDIRKRNESGGIRRYKFRIALFDKRDSLHQIAAEVLSRIPSQTRIVTSQIVFSQVLELFAKSSSYIKEELTDFIEEMVEHSYLLLEPSTPKLRDDTVAFYRKHSDKEWGFIDCSSFVIMKRRQIKEALTHDHHFIQAGFKALLRD